MQEGDKQPELWASALFTFTNSNQEEHTEHWAIVLNEKLNTMLVFPAAEQRNKRHREAWKKKKVKVVLYCDVTDQKSEAGL